MSQLKTEQSNGTLERDKDGRWFVRTDLCGTRPLMGDIAKKPDADSAGAAVSATLLGMPGTPSSFIVTDYHFI